MVDEPAGGPDADAVEDGESEWRFGLDDVGPEAEPDPLEPGSPTLENVVFVVLGAVGTVLAIIQLVRPFA